MAAKIQLNIPEPCSENWANMDRTEKGRFCQACQKQVIDFTGMDEQQLALFFKNATGSVCGRMRTEQLKQELTLPRKRIHWVRYFLQVALPAMILSNKGYTQGKVAFKQPNLMLEQQKDSLRLKNEQINSSTPYRMISGRVVDLEGRPVADAIVWTPQGTSGAVTDAHGSFRFSVLRSEPTIQLQVSGAGFVTQSLELKQNAAFLHALIKVEKAEPDFSNIILGGISIAPVKVAGKKKRVPAARPAELHVAKPSTSFIDTMRTFFKLYPNPVSAGASVNIELLQEISEGYFDMDILTVDGKKVHGKNKLWIDKEARVLNIQIPAMAAGNYLFVLRSRKSGQAFSQQIVIQ